MIDVHTVYLVGLVSQATFSLTLSLLAWSDRRTKGTVWLAGACGLQFLWTTARSIDHGCVTAMTETFSALLLVMLFYVVFMAFRWFTRGRGVSGPAEQWALGGAMAAILLAAAMGPEQAVLVARLVALFIGAKAVAMAWKPKMPELRTPARVCAVLLGLTMVIIVANLLGGLPMEARLELSLEAHFTNLLRGMTISLVTLLSFSFMALYVGETNRRLQEDTRTDSLTLLRNRRSMEEVARREVHRATERQTPLALLMMDLDHFKNLNDTWGHALGDRALRAVGTVLQEGVDGRGLTARMGGEEFAVLLPGHDLEQAALLAEQLRQQIAALQLHEVSISATVTVSIGVSALRAGEQAWTEMLCHADDALYRAKREGRNRVEVCAIGGDTVVERVEGVRAWRSRWAMAVGQGIGE